MVRKWAAAHPDLVKLQPARRMLAWLDLEIESIPGLIR
jgi:hypothetical protein